MRTYEDARVIDVILDFRFDRGSTFRALEAALRCTQPPCSEALASDVLSDARIEEAAVTQKIAVSKSFKR
jgi:hypothetical protein